MQSELIIHSPTTVILKPLNIKEDLKNTQIEIAQA